MKLFRQPGPPQDGSLFFVYDHHRDVRQEWKKYLPSFRSAA